MIANTPPPPYYAVIFTSVKTDADAGYNDASQLMVELAKQQSGYLGHESARDGIGITISYWQSLDAIKAWKQQTDHALIQQMGISQWYKCYKTRICLVERDYGFEK